MTEHINQIIKTSTAHHVYLQSVYNDVDESGAPVAGNSYYVGCPCTGAEDATPLAGHQPGEVYQTDGIASLEAAPTDITL